MIYLVLIIALVTGIMSTTLLQNPLSQILEKSRANIERQILPKTEKEILVDNLQKEHDVLNRFFSEAAPALLKSSSVADREKNDLIQAIESFKEAQEVTQELEELESKTPSVLQKIFDTVVPDSFSGQSSINPSPTLTPTTLPNVSIPPQCNLVCK